MAEEVLTIGRARACTKNGNHGSAKAQMCRCMEDQTTDAMKLGRSRSNERTATVSMAMGDQVI